MITGYFPVDETHDPAATSWLADANHHADFPVQNLPLGIFSSRQDTRCRGGTAIGNHVLDLARLAPLLSDEASAAAEACEATTLNTLLALGTSPRRALRREVFGLLTDPARESQVRPALTHISECELHLPAAVGDYTDFYTGIHHAENIGRLLRPDAPLLPNYKYVPIGYHGRSSSIAVSGATVVRPKAQTKGPDDKAPVYRASQRLDFELEMGVWIARGNPRGKPIPIEAADEHVAGLCLLNDWSARDVQAWEYQPLGPFLAKNFLTTVSPWIITSEALAPYRIPQPPRVAEDPTPLPYLWNERDQSSGAYAVHLDVFIRSERMRQANLPAHQLSQVAMDVMYWTVAQLIAHHTSNGCNLTPGDLLGTGTLSGAEPSSLGSLMELTHGGRQSLQLPGNEPRSFLQDGDEIAMHAYAHAPGFTRIGFGECIGKVVAAPRSPDSDPRTLIS